MKKIAAILFTLNDRQWYLRQSAECDELGATSWPQALSEAAELLQPGVAVALGLPSEECFAVVIDSPGRKSNSKTDSVKFEAEAVLPLRAEEMAISQTIVEDRLFLACTNDAQLRDLFHVANDTGLEVISALPTVGLLAQAALAPAESGCFVLRNRHALDRIELRNSRMVHWSHRKASAQENRGLSVGDVCVENRADDEPAEATSLSALATRIEPGACVGYWIPRARRSSSFHSFLDHRWFRFAASLACITLLLLSAGFERRARISHKQAQSARQMQERIYAELVPGSTVPVGIVDRLTSLQRRDAARPSPDWAPASAARPFFALLEQLPNEAEGWSVNAARLTGENVSIEGDADDHEVVSALAEQMKKLSGEPGSPLTPQVRRREDGSVSFTLSLNYREATR